MSFESVDARRRRTTAYPINPPELGSGELKKKQKTHTHTHKKHTKPDSADMVYISRLVSAFYSIIMVSEKITFILFFFFFFAFCIPWQPIKKGRRPEIIWQIEDCCRPKLPPELGSGELKKKVQILYATLT